jgi:hypothetical protein
MSRRLRDARFSEAAAVASLFFVEKIKANSRHQSTTPCILADRWTVGENLVKLTGANLTAKN